jgi:hypothetical protein
MSTRYILVGGRDDVVDDGRALFEAIMKGYDRPVHVLSCCFAEPPESWPEKYERKAKQFFARNLGDRMTCELAQPDTFTEQAARADILYLHGGTTRTLIDQMNNIPNASKLFTGKTVVGSSAGGCYLASRYWAPGVRKTGEGSGILPIAFMPHYDSDYGSDDPRGPIDWQKARAELETDAGSLPVYCVREGEFVEFTT